MFEKKGCNASNVRYVLRHGDGAHHRSYSDWGPHTKNPPPREEGDTRTTVPQDNSAVSQQYDYIC